MLPNSSPPPTWVIAKFFSKKKHKKYHFQYYHSTRKPPRSGKEKTEVKLCIYESHTLSNFVRKCDWNLSNQVRLNLFPTYPGPQPDVWLQRSPVKDCISTVWPAVVWPPFQTVCYVDSNRISCCHNTHPTHHWTTLLALSTFQWLTFCASFIYFNPWKKLVNS